MLLCLWISPSSVSHMKEKLNQASVTACAVSYCIMNPTGPTQTKSGPFSDTYIPLVPMHQQKSLSLPSAFNQLGSFKIYL